MPQSSLQTQISDLLQKSAAEVEISLLSVKNFASRKVPVNFTLPHCYHKLSCFVIT